jgi:hypothetical protein
MTTTVTSEQGKPEIVATAGRYYRVTRYVITAVMIAMGFWFGYDGFVNWPEQNRRIAPLEVQHREAVAAEDTGRASQIMEEINAIGKVHTDWDIGLQRVLFFTLPPLAIALFIRWMYISRGAYRLSADNVLEAPGHPPVPLDSITELDKRLWDRKGIAFIGYELPGGRSGRLKLDDFVYEREPTDEIYKRIEDFVSPPAAEPPQAAPDTQVSAK